MVTDLLIERNFFLFSQKEGKVPPEGEKMVKRKF